jgi:hypothetical protein
MSQPETQEVQEARRYRRDLVGKCIKRLYELYGQDRETWPQAVHDKNFSLIAGCPSFGYEECEELARWLKESYSVTTQHMYPTQQKRPSFQAGKDRPSSTVARVSERGQARTKPSYLSEVKGNLFTLVKAQLPNTDETGAQEFTEALWHFVQPRITESYWNGVSAGASGRVKPKTQRIRQEKRG